jgi:hypothetical protein
MIKPWIWIINKVVIDGINYGDTVTHLMLIRGVELQFQSRFRIHLRNFVSNFRIGDSSVPIELAQVKSMIFTTHFIIHSVTIYKWCLSKKKIQDRLTD